MLVLTTLQLSFGTAATDAYDDDAGDCDDNYGSIAGCARGEGVLGKPYVQLLCWSSAADAMSVDVGTVFLVAADKPICFSGVVMSSISRESMPDPGNCGDELRLLPAPLLLLLLL